MTPHAKPSSTVTSTAQRAKPEIAYELLKERLRRGDYSPEARLVIDHLVRETGISAIPWREALRALAAEGWVEIIPNVGARVAALDSKAYLQILPVLARLEGYATALAVPHLDDAAIDDARRINQDMRQALADFDPARFSDLNRQFHSVFNDRCGDEYLQKLVVSQWDRLDRIRRTAFSSVPGRARNSVAEHDHLVDLMVRGAAIDEIETAARTHKLNMLAAIQTIM